MAFNEILALFCAATSMSINGNKYVVYFLAVEDSIKKIF
jgi:hypothetical protein